MRLKCSRQFTSKPGYISVQARPHTSPGQERHLSRHFETLSTAKFNVLLHLICNPPKRQHYLHLLNPGTLHQDHSHRSHKGRERTTMPKTVLITGCTPGGIGHALALEFHHRGHNVLATARDPSTLTSLSALGIHTLPLEATSDSSIQTLFQTVSDLTRGKLNILINNAGRNYTVPALDIDPDEVRQTFETNVFAVMRLCQIFAPLLIASQDSTIVQIGSLAGKIPYAFGSVYNASKAALHSYSDTLRVELAPFGVRVVTVVTGGVKSNIARTKRGLPEGSLYVPIAAAYEGRQVHSQDVGMRAEEYARSVVGQVLERPRRDTIWEGGKVWLVWFAVTFFPRWVVVSVLLDRGVDDQGYELTPPPGRMDDTDIPAGQAYASGYEED